VLIFGRGQALLEGYLHRDFQGAYSDDIRIFQREGKIRGKVKMEIFKAFLGLMDSLYKLI